MLDALLPIVLLANGMAAGVLVGTQLGGWPLLESLPPERYVQAHAFFSTRYDPFMPIAFVITAIGDGTLAVLVDGVGTTVLLLTAVALVAGTIAVSLLRNAPINRWIRTLDPRALPADFANLDPRMCWGRWNRVRTALAVSGLVANCAAAGLLL